MIHIIGEDPFIRNVISTVSVFLSRRCREFESADSYRLYLGGDAFIPPEIVFSNLGMSETMDSGIIPIVKLCNPEVKFVLMKDCFAQAADQSSIENSAEYLVDHTFQKPFNVKKLMEYVHRHSHHMGSFTATMQKPVRVSFTGTTEFPASFRSL